MIYFGIARCRIGADTMSKELGKQLAKQRLIYAIHAKDSNNLDMWEEDGTLKLRKPNGLFGMVHVNDVKKLLNYFDNLEKIMYVKDQKEYQES